MTVFRMSRTMPTCYSVHRGKTNTHPGGLALTDHSSRNIYIYELPGVQRAVLGSSRTHKTLYITTSTKANLAEIAVQMKNTIYYHTWYMCHTAYVS